MAGRLVERADGADPAASPAMGARVLCPGGRTPDGVGRQYGGHQRLHAVPVASLTPVPEPLAAADVALNKLAGIAHRGRQAGGAAAAGGRARCDRPARGEAVARSEVTAVDPSAERASVAEAAGGTARASLSAAGDGFDAVVDCTGVPAVMNEALPLLRQDPWEQGSRSGPVYVLQGSTAGRVSFDDETAFQRQVSVVLPRDATRLDEAETLRLVGEGRLRHDDLLTRFAAPADAAAVYAGLGRRDGGAAPLGVAFDWSRSLS